MRATHPRPTLTPNKQTWIRHAILAGFIAGVLGSTNAIASDSGGTRIAQTEKSSMPSAGTTAKTSSATAARGKEKKSPEKEKIRTRSIQPEKAGPGTSAPMEKAPSIDADAQKGLVDRMKGCCDAPKN